MGNTDADHAADRHDIDMSEEEEARLRQDLEDAQEEQLRLREEVERERFASVFGDLAAQMEAHNRFDYLVWLAPLLKAADDLNKSASRATICVALAGMPDYKVDDDRDEPKGLPGGTDMLDAIMPPATDSTWGSYGRPKRSIFHQITRMEGKDMKGRPVNLIKILYHPRVGNQPGELVRGYALDSVGIVYAHLHGKGKVAQDDLYYYWLNAERDVEKREATNPAYLAMIGEGPPVDTSPHRWQTSAYSWGVLASLQREDTSVPERYKAVSPMKLSTSLVAVYGKDAVVCLKFLDKGDQRAVFEDVMFHSKVGASKYARSKILGDLDRCKTYADKIELLVTMYDSEHQAPPDSTTVIEELICRCTWAVISRVIGHRIGDPEEHTVDVATELMSHARTFEQIEALQQLVGDMEARVAIATAIVSEQRDMTKGTGPARLG